MDPSDASAGTFFYVLDDPLRLLFVDDDPILREFAVVHLSTDKARVAVAGDGVQALEHLGRERFDLVLLDLEMPTMDGFEVLRRMRDEPATATTPVIVVTGREDVSAIDRAFLAGATSFIVKPLNWRLLAYQIRFVHRAFRTEQTLRGAKARERGERGREAQLRRLAHDGADMLSLAMGGGPELRRAAVRYAASLNEAVSPALVEAGS
jgi:DNA-binding response OmpR family regulator